MVKLEIDYSKCDKCLECVDICAPEALTFEDEEFIFKAEECTYCEICLDICEKEAIRLYD